MLLITFHITFTDDYIPKLLTKLAESYLE